jgi:hypothetical protein
VSFLRDHALQGRLTHDELEERIGLAYAAKTVGELEGLISDLPRAHSPAPRRPRPVRRQHGPNPALLVGLLLFTGIPVVAAAGVIALLAIVFAVSVVLGPFLLVGLIIALASRRRRPPMRWGY